MSGGGDPVATRRMAALLHARTRTFRARLAEAERIVDGWLSRVRSPAVEFSSGKDSHVVLDLVRRAAPDAVALHGDDEWLLPEMEAVLAATPNVVRIRRRLTHTDWFVAWEEMGGPDGGGKHRWAIEHGVDGVASGLRAEESADRRRHIQIRGSAFTLANGLHRAYPIAWWSWRDVWAYIESRSVPYCAAYDVLARIGVPSDRQRIGPIATERALAGGQLVALKRGWPDLYRRFAAKYPEASHYV